MTKFQLLDLVFPEFRATHQLSDEEKLLLKKSPKDHPNLEERDKAITEVSTLAWGTLGKTSRAGAVQKLVVLQSMLLIEAKTTREGTPIVVKAATDDHDLIIEFYIRPRGDQLVKVSGGVRDDCSMVGMTFEGITDRMKAELGVHVSTAVGNILQVASPNFSALTTGPARAAKALAANTQKD